MAKASEVRMGRTRGERAEEVSRAFVQLMKEHGGKGPTKCRTYVEDDLIVVVMQGGYTRAEGTLFDDGKWRDVRTMRHAFQDTMEGRFTDVIEREMGRQVKAFMSASHQDPDVQVETFLLDGETDSTSASALAD